MRRTVITGIVGVILLISIVAVLYLANWVSVYASILKNGPLPLRVLSAYRLGYAEDNDAIDPLIEALGDKSPAVVRAAACSLGRIGNVKAVSPLCKVWRVSTDERAANAALLSLVAIAAKKHSEPSEEDVYGTNLDDVIFLEINRGITAGPVRSRAGKDETPDVIDVLTPCLKRGSPEVRIVTARIMGDLGGAGAVETLLSSVDDGNPVVRIHVIRALGTTRDNRAIEPIITALNDRDVRFTAIYALLYFRDPRIPELLIKLLSDPDPKVRSACAEVLGEMKEPKAVKPLIEAYDNNPQDVQNEILKALASIQDPESLGVFIEALGGPYKGAWITALTALSTMDNPEAVRAVRDFLLDEERYEEIKYTLDYEVRDRIEESWAMDSFLGSAEPASVKLYAAWLIDWIHQGGKVNDGWPNDTGNLSRMYEIADGSVITPRYGARAVEIIAPKGVSFTIADLGHSQIFYWDSDGTARLKGIRNAPPVYKDVKEYLKRLNDPMINKALTL